MSAQLFTPSLQFMSLPFPFPLVRKEKSVDSPESLGSFYILFHSVEDGYAGVQGGCSMSFNQAEVLSHF